MTTGSEQNDQRNSTDLPQWKDCDFFCINHYAGTGASPCGWRGRLQDARHGKNGAKILCPRCGCATLFRIPPSRGEDTRV